MNTIDRTHIKPARARQPRRARVRGAGWARQRGSAMIEFPFAVLILMLMLVIVADLGRLTPWAQQVAYSADAGVQFAYQTYSYSSSDDNYRNDITDVDGLSFEDIKSKIKEHIQSAVGGEDNRLNIEDDDIEVDEILRCSNASFSGETLTVNYTDKGGSDCPDDQREVVFIEVTVENIFDPFTPWIERIMPEDLRTQTFTIRRQIFPR